MLFYVTNVHFVNCYNQFYLVLGDGALFWSNEVKPKKLS